jgi:Holliday junction DNA helicase RuvA
MIVRVTGEVLEVGDGHLVISLGGLGLEVRVSVRTGERLAQERGEVTLFTYLHVRENELSLYGCQTQEEMALFRKLLEVSGVGPKLALAILAGLEAEELKAALSRGDSEALVKVPGVGRRLAERMILELKGKLPAPALTSGPVGSSDGREELLAALMALGFSRSEAQSAASSLPVEDLSLEVEEQVRSALGYFVRER